jgi:ubiquinone/menaquinone biosynthesis C-methylase UbiE
MVAVAARRSDGTRARFAVAAAEALPFASESFGGAVASMTLHHWADARRGVTEVARVLRPHATFVIADIDLPSLARRALRALGRSHAGWSRRELAHMLYAAGFRSVRATTRGPVDRRLPVIVAVR